MHAPRLRILWTCPALLALLALPMGCGNRPDRVADPPAALRGTGPSGGSPSNPLEYIAILSGRRPLSEVVAEQHLVLKAPVADDLLILFEAPGRTLRDLEESPDFAAVETNDEVNLSEAINLVVAFVEGDWVEGDYPDQPALESMNLEAVHAVATGEGIRVGVIDTGVDPKHPHLLGRVEIIDDPILGLPIESANGINDEGDGSATDQAYGHGSHVAGAILTVAPDATVVPFKALDDEGRGTDYTVAAGLLASARGKPVNIVNLSVKIQEEAPVVSWLLQFLHNRGVIVVAAAGNNEPGNSVVYPASHPVVYGIAAGGNGIAPDGGQLDTLAPFSGRGAEASFAAIGVAVGSCVPSPRGQAWVKRATGTSIACAVASGCIAVVMEDDPDPVGALMATVQPVVPLTDVRFGRLSPYHALGLDGE